MKKFKFYIYTFGFALLSLMFLTGGQSNVQAVSYTTLTLDLKTNYCKGNISYKAGYQITNENNTCNVYHEVEFPSLTGSKTYGYVLNQSAGFCTKRDNRSVRTGETRKYNYTYVDVKNKKYWAQYTALSTATYQPIGGGIGSQTTSSKQQKVNLQVKAIEPSCTAYAQLETMGGSKINPAYTTSNTQWFKSPGTYDRDYRIYFYLKSANDNGGSSVKTPSKAKYSASGSSISLTNNMITSLKVENYFGLSATCKLSGNYKIDGDLPSCSVTSNNTKWTNGNVNLSFKCSDSSSGCATPSRTITVTTNGTYSYPCRDNVGNSSTNATINVTNIDKTNPSCGTTTPLNTNYYYNTSYGVKVRCSDGQSGCTASSYNGTATSSGNSSITIKDNAGNTSTCSATTQQFDTSAPTTKITLNAGQEGYNAYGHQTSSNVTATISATDSGRSGVYQVCYTLSGATTKGTTCVNGSSTTVQISNTGSTTITAWSYDNAYDYNNGSPKRNGNKSAEVTKTVYVDKVNPTISISTPSNTWTNSLPTLSFNVSDANSGVRTVQYVWAPTRNSTTAFNNYASTGQTITANSQGGAMLSYVATFPESAKNDKSLSDALYLHVKVCDRAYSTYNTQAPNCTTSVSSSAYKFDFVNDSDISISGGGTDSGSYAGNGVDWTHILKDLAINVVNDSVGSTRSGIERINLYFDTNSTHVNEDKNKATFASSPDLVKICSTDHTSSSPTTCKFVIDFAALKSDPVQSGQPYVAEEGVRFIKVEVIDLAGNKTSKVFGPFKWDITKSQITSNITISGTEDGKFFVDR